MKFYGTMMCKDTVYADKVLRKNGIDIEYIDITASMQNLKEFLKFRDSNKEFDSIKADGKAGVPVFILDDGSITFDLFDIEGVNKEIESNDGDSLSSGMCEIF